MEPMDSTRLGDALTQWRRNRNKALRKAGIGLGADVGLRGTTPGAMDGVDATAEDLVAYLSWLRSSEIAMNATLRHAASLGMAVEVGFHEMAGEEGRVASALSAATRALPEGHPAAVQAAEGGEALGRIMATMRLNAGIGLSRAGSYSDGAKLAAEIGRRFSHPRRGAPTLEITDAFRSAPGIGRTSLVTPALLNIVSNAWYWADRSTGDKVVRLDAYRVVTREADPSVDPDDPDDGWMAEASVDDVLVIEDSGPGVPPQHAADLFRPFRSKRFGGTGVGLYLCRRNLEESGDTVVLDPAGSPLGGARFLVGPKSVLSPVPVPEPTRAEFLALEAVGIARMMLDGQGQTLLREFADTHAEICREALRVRMDGPRDRADAILLRAADAMAGILEGRLDASALEPFEDPALAPPGP